jgi:alkanesulfonate monooxygenase SsuD/methylene tetrahydromethanopterin reductase-like flavin-dependent oxidoreductase (luciferase family)
MSRNLSFGVITIQNTPWPSMVERWLRFEALGFDSVWLADHFYNYVAPEQPFWEAWTSLAALAVHTSRIRVGTLVSQIPFRNPALFASEALTVDHISNGRLEIGLGTGSQGDPGNTMMGLENWPPAERVARFREYIEIVDTLLCNGTADYQGTYYQAKEASLNPRPVQKPRPPITIAALGPSMLRIAARYADRWNTYPAGTTSEPEAFRVLKERNAQLDDACAQIGRDPSEISRSILVYYRLGDLRPFASVGAFEDYVGGYREAGINEFMFYHPLKEWYKSSTDVDEEVFEQVATEVIPRLKEQG